MQINNPIIDSTYLKTKSQFQSSDALTKQTKIRAVLSSKPYLPHPNDLIESGV